jgi:tripartite ATP-independent transporter DctM subunit
MLDDVSGRMNHGAIAIAQAGGAVQRPWMRAVDRGTQLIVEPLVAALIVAEFVILTAGIYSRYVMGSALAWTDELASILFLWLTMLGTVNAYRQDKHMRLTMLVNLVQPEQAEVLNAISDVVVLTFSILLLAAVVVPPFGQWPEGVSAILRGLSDGSFLAQSYFGQELIDFTPALHIPQSYAILGIAVSLVFIIYLAALRLISRPAKVYLPVLVAALAVLVAAYLARDIFAGLGNINLIIFFVFVVGAGVAVGVPIAFAFGIATLSYLGLVTYSPTSVVAGQMDQGMTDLVLLAIPMFVLLGLLMDAVGIARRLVEAIAAFVGHLRGGLNIVLVVAMFLVSGISGSKLADMAAVTPVLFPEMERRGHSRSEMISLLSTSGAMAELIPPSLVLIVLGTVCNLSIQNLFTAGLLPAAVASLCLIVVSMIRSRRENVTLGARASYSRRGKALFVALPGLILPFIIRYMVVAGITTPTEVSTMGIVYCLIVGIFIYREFDWRLVYPMLVETADLTGAIVFIIAMATAMGWALTQSGFAAELAAVLEHAPGGAAGFMVLSILLFVVLGSVLEGIPAIVLFGPLLFPIARALGINEIHFAVVAVLAMSIGLFTPPIGVGYYGACAVGKCDPGKAAGSILPYILGLIVALALIAAIPWLSTGFL